MTRPRKILGIAVIVATSFSLPGRARAQSGTVTDDGFVSSSPATQQVNRNGQGIVLIVAGSSATVGWASVGTTKAFVKFQLSSSLPPATAAANVAKATLKLAVRLYWMLRLEVDYAQLIQGSHAGEPVSFRGRR